MDGTANQTRTANRAQDAHLLGSSCFDAVVTSPVPRRAACGLASFLGGLNSPYDVKYAMSAMKIGKKLGCNSKFWGAKLGEA
jgi:hypothetical protein